MVAADCSVQMKAHLEDLDKVPDRHELEVNKGNQKTMKHDVFFETLTLHMNDPDFSGELPFHDDHLDEKDGKPGIFQHRDVVNDLLGNKSKTCRFLNSSFHIKEITNNNFVT